MYELQTHEEEILFSNCVDTIVREDSKFERNFLHRMPDEKLVKRVIAQLMSGGGRKEKPWTTTSSLKGILLSGYSQTNKE
jgi:hypothetical protein